MPGAVAGNGPPLEPGDDHSVVAAIERNFVMFDLSRLSETFSGLLGGNAAQQALQSLGVDDLLQRAGLDANQLEGLDQNQVLGLLAQHGIDLSQLGADQLNELASRLGVPEEIGSIATSWFGGDGPKS
jgi:hypothetical protein